MADSRPYDNTHRSRPARALWIEILTAYHPHRSQMRRGPRGPCGLKFCARPRNQNLSPSRPARALWIEIPNREYPGRYWRSRGPRGPCGLKFLYLLCHMDYSLSRPARALWIEIVPATCLPHASGTSRPARALWIEISNGYFVFNESTGRGPRGPCGLKSAL